MSRSLIRKVLVSAAAVVTLAGAGYGGWLALDQKAPADPRLASIMTLPLARLP